MKTFKLKLSYWMEANPGVLPIGYNIHIRTESIPYLNGLFDEFLENFEFVVIRYRGTSMKFKGLVSVAEIELPIDILKETETLREEKINEIFK